ncbi:hypothetical protein BVRB_4g071970 [Beta vulgaris subsp. vulgaris]|nr:hypothetical protein BVRB_4g071970 [Beta vulgaris subsp. vulgaris]
MAWPYSCTLSLLLTLKLLLLSSIAAQNTGNIPVGRSLLATATFNDSSLLSPSGDFAFGFSRLSNTTNLFLLAIWYAQSPDTIVWYANDGNPVPEGSSVRITANEGLVLSDPQGSNLWSTLNNSRNVGVILRTNGVINSRHSETNFTTGRFQYRLTSDGRMVLNVMKLTTGYPYNAYHVSDRTNAGQAQRFVYNESGYMYILRKDGTRFNMLPEDYTPSEDDYQRLTLSFQGILTWYSSPKASVSNGWSINRVVPDDICMTEAVQNLGSGICGSNSICNFDNRRLTCTCPQGYSLLDPKDQYSSCKPDFELDSCEGYPKSTMKGEYKLVSLLNTDFTLNDYERLNATNEEDCKNFCLEDCVCAAVVFQLGGKVPGCWKKKAPLTNGRKDMVAISVVSWIKVGNANISSDPHNPSVTLATKKKIKLNTLAKVLIGGSVSVNFLLLSSISLGIFFIYHKKQLKVFYVGQRNTLREYSNVHCFSYQELNEATNEFKEELGRGSFGIVYKGIITAGGPPVCVAVKKLDRTSGDTEKEFKTEVNVIGQTHHKNLVQLIGYCKENDQRLLVYEYMSNGSLADYLFGDLRPSWVDRVQIAQGIAKGLLYLHEECSTQIIHCDIKPQNILLDEYQNARISDFGLAKLLVLNQTQTNTAIRGTKGYVAPEWFRNKPVTVKVDVYSFGVLLLEIICCRKSIRMEFIEEGAAILTDWAFDCYQSNRLDSLVNDDMEALDDIICLKRFVMVALWCIQEDPSLRPTMRMVTQMLEGLAEVPNTPPCPASFSVTTQQ